MRKSIDTDAESDSCRARVSLTSARRDPPQLVVETVWFSAPLSTDTSARVSTFSSVSPNSSHENAASSSFASKWNEISSVGAGVGVPVGAEDGTAVGDGIGTAVGDGIGTVVGAGNGTDVGAGSGTGVGSAEGSELGRSVGIGVGASVGNIVGIGVGANVGAVEIVGENVG